MAACMRVCVCVCVCVSVCVSVCVCVVGGRCLLNSTYTIDGDDGDWQCSPNRVLS